MVMRPLLIALFLSARILSAAETDLNSLSPEDIAERINAHPNLLVPPDWPKPSTPRSKPVRSNLNDAGYMNVDDPDVSKELRRRARAVASIGLDSNGYFIVDFDPDALKLPVKDSQYNMGLLIEMYAGILHGEQIHLPATYDPLLSHLVDSKLLRGSPVWTAPTTNRAAPGQGYCSAFLIGDNLAMTANHCMATDHLCRVTLLRFNEEMGGAVDAFACRKVLFTDEKLDISVLELEGMPGIKYGHLTLASRVPEWRESGLRTFGHPSDHGDAVGSRLNSLKKISRSCRTSGNIAERRFGRVVTPLGDGRAIDFDELFKNHRYAPTLQGGAVFDVNCRAFGGQSGSPVLSEAGEVLGIISSSTDGDLSKAVPMSLIVERHGRRLRELGASVADR
jgi:hypothetical protein